MSTHGDGDDGDDDNDDDAGDDGSERSEDYLPVPTRVFGIKCVAGDPSVRSRRLICAVSLVYHHFLGNIIIIICAESLVYHHFPYLLRSCFCLSACYSQVYTISDSI